MAPSCMSGARRPGHSGAQLSFSSTQDPTPRFYVQPWSSEPRRSEMGLDMAHIKAHPWEYSTVHWFLGARPRDLWRGSLNLETTYVSKRSIRACGGRSLSIIVPGHLPDEEDHGEQSFRKSNSLSSSFGSAYSRIPRHSTKKGGGWLST